MMDTVSPRGVFVHPNALCESADIGNGTRVWAFAHILPGAKIGMDCNVCDAAYIEGGVTIGHGVTIKNQVQVFDGVTIEDNVFLGPGVVFTNDVHPRAHIKRSGADLRQTTVHEGVTLGAGVIVVCGITLGANAFVGAGGVVTRDVAPHAFMVGNPARQIGWACRCGQRLPDALACGECGRTYRIDQSRSTLEFLQRDEQH